MLSERLQKIDENIRAACIKSGRPDAETPLMVAVSKTHPPEILRKALELGVEVFGESRVQEARAKIPLLPPRCRWHFIGHLQKNKIRQALPLFELFHGIDSLDTARNIDRVSDELGLFPKVLLEINLSGESSKFGFSEENLFASIEELLRMRRVQIIGLMTIPPPAPEAEQNRPFFRKLRHLRDRIHLAHGTLLPELSMGMSDDYSVAVEEGATMVRIGSALFGSRAGKAWKPSAAESLDD